MRKRSKMRKGKTYSPKRGGKFPLPFPSVKPGEEVPDHTQDEKEAYEELCGHVVMLRRMGWSYRQIGAHPKVQRHHSSCQQIFEKMLMSGVRRQIAEDVEAWREEKLEELRELKKITYEVFLSSREPSQEESVEKLTTGDAPPGEPETGKRKEAGKKAKYRERISKKVQGRDGSVHALMLIKEIIEAECKLRGVVPTGNEAAEGGAVIKFFLPATERNKKHVNGEYDLPEPKQVPAKTISLKKPMPARMAPSELVVVERTPALPGSEDVK